MSLKKRQATTELNHDNWDQEEPNDDEDPMGKFKAASEEELQKRVFRTAKRRSLNTARVDPTAANKSPFGAFTGFKKVPPSSFDFLANLTNSPTANGGSTTDNNSSNPFGNPSNTTLSPNQGKEENTPKSNQNLFGSPSNTPLFTPMKSDGKNTFSSPGFGFKSNIDSDQSASSSPSMLKSSGSTLFSNTNPVTSNNPVFGSNTSASVFSSANTAATTTNSVFGATKPAATLFSSSLTTPPSTNSKSVFGAQNTNTSLFSTTPTSKTNSFGSGTPSTLFTPTQVATGSKESPFKITSTPTLSNSNVDFPFKTNTVGSMPAQVSSSVFGSNNKSLFGATAVETAPTTFDSQKTQQPKSSPFGSSNDKSCNTENTSFSKHDLICFAKLKALNQSVTAWIKKNVEETPCCILSPVFKDYEEHLKGIHKEYMQGHETESNGSNSTNNTSSIFGKQTETKNNGSDAEKASPFKSNSATPSFTLGGNNTPASKAETTSTGSLFGCKPSSNIPFSAATSNTTPNNNFSFGIKSSPSNETGKTNDTMKTNSSAGFSFGTKPNDTTSKGSPISAPTNNFSFGIKPATTDTSASNSTTSPGFSFGLKPASEGTTTAPPANPSFSFGTKPPENTGENKPFSFDVGKPFSFNSNTIQKPSENKEEQKDEDDEPPKVEYTPVVEENSVYEKKCKVFVKKDSNFADKGVGTLFVKKVDDSGKHQILVRANNNLGTIILNFILSSGIPTQRMGKNNVMMVCIPTPDSKPPPTPILIRVKTSEEADELLAELNKLKS